MPAKTDTPQRGTGEGRNGGTNIKTPRCGGKWWECDSWVLKALKYDSIGILLNTFLIARNKPLGTLREHHLPYRLGVTRS